jgi:hypothetical protein
VKVGDSKLREAKWVDNDRIMTRLSVTVLGMHSSDAADELHHLLIYNLKDRSLKEPSFATETGGGVTAVAGGSMVAFDCVIGDRTTGCQVCFLR